MKPARFKYWDPPSIKDVASLLHDYAEDAKVLAGGQSLMPVLSMRLARVDQLIDINGVEELGYIRREDGRVCIGALTRHHELMESAVISEQLPLVSKALPYIGHTAIRYRGTLGGTLAHADPSAELPAVMLTLGAEIELTSKAGTRTVAADEFFVTYFTTALRPDEFVTEIRVPVKRRQASVVKELARRHGDFALAGIAATLSLVNGRTDSIEVSAFGIDEVPRRLTEVEALLRGQEPDEESIAEARQIAAAAVEPESDMHASGDYRSRMTGVLLERALKEAFADAGAENFVERRV